MRCQRRGTELQIMIRLALHDLGRDPFSLDSFRLTIAGKEEMLRHLTEQKKKQDTA